MFTSSGPSKTFPSSSTLIRFEAFTSSAGNETIITDGAYKVIKWIKDNEY